MNERETGFRRWLTDFLEQNQGTISYYEALNSGAYHCDCSQTTIGRYLKKWAYSREILFVPTGDKTMNGHLIYNVKLNQT